MDLAVSTISTRSASHDVAADQLLSLIHVSKFYPGPERKEVRVLEDICFDLPRGEFSSIVGPSGCGKTTLLKLSAGLLSTSAGMVRFENAAVDDPPAGAVYLSQQYSKSLFPWRTVRQNVEFPLENAGLPRSERRARAYDVLRGVGLENAIDHYPWQLSGGMQQRVAIARAIAARPRLLLMDEPFSSVDALTRMELQDLIMRAWSEHRLTVLLVTHDIEEAIYLSDRVAVMVRNPTRIVETIPVNLSRPRDQLRTREASRFIELRHHIYDLVRGPEPSLS
jgi:NitT/TauT family transport system ATP-binding protein